MTQRAARSPFLAILGLWKLSDPTTSAGSFYPDGLRWRIDPGRELSRFASRAMEACGRKTSWQEIEDLARTAMANIESLSHDLADKWRVELERPDMNASRLILVHGPADLLASGRLWELKDEQFPWIDDGLDGRKVLAAFALLMADHAANDLAADDSGSALAFLAIAGTALAHATMDQATSAAAEASFRQRAADERTAKAKLMAKARYLPLEQHRGAALQMAREKHYPKRIDAARDIAQNLVKAVSNGKESFYTAETIDRWLKDAGL